MARWTPSRFGVVWFGGSCQTKARSGPVDPTLAGTMPTFEKPRKAILTKEHLAQFQASQCHKDIVSYIESLNASVTGVKLSDECPQSPVSYIPPWISDHAVRVILGNRGDFVSVRSSRGTRSGYTAG